MSDDRPTYEELQERLQRAEGVVDALRRHEVDVIVGDQQVAYVRLKEVEDKLEARSEELRRLNENLERQVAERTEVAEKRAALLQRMATELLQAEQRERRRLSRLLHDHLQQLLTAAQLRTQMLEARLDPDSDLAAVTELRNLLCEAVDASRSLALELSPPVLAHGLPAALEWLADQMRSRHRLNVKVKMDGSARPRSEELSAFLLQAARELLFNVVKHAGVDEAALAVSCEEDQVVLAVADQGRGFDRSAMQSLDGAETAGAGLAGIRRRVELLGGTMEISSILGEGAEFILRVPCEVVEEAEATPEQAQPAMGQAGASGPSRGGRWRVVVVDDHDIVREGIVGLLEDHPQMEVVGEACDGRTAIAMAEELQPDVMVMDVNMPEVNGIEATRRISAASPEIRIIGLSMHGDGEVKRKMLEAGASAYVAKGGPYEDLMGAIQVDQDRAAQ